MLYIAYLTNAHLQSGDNLKKENIIILSKSSGNPNLTSFHGRNTSRVARRQLQLAVVVVRQSRGASSPKASVQLQARPRRPWTACAVHYTITPHRQRWAQCALLRQPPLRLRAEQSRTQQPPFPPKLTLAARAVQLRPPLCPGEKPLRGAPSLETHAQLTPRSRSLRHETVAPRTTRYPPQQAKCALLRQCLSQFPGELSRIPRRKQSPLESVRGARGGPRSRDHLRSVEPVARRSDSSE
jgi:hypothetical protein